jgi:hypothetical protein
MEGTYDNEGDGDVDIGNAFEDGSTNDNEDDIDLHFEEGLEEFPDSSSETSTTVQLPALPPSTPSMTFRGSLLLPRMVVITDSYEMDLKMVSQDTLEEVLETSVVHFEDNFGAVIASAVHNYPEGCSLIFEFERAVDTQDCIENGRSVFREVRICSAMGTSFTYFPNMMPPYYHHDAGVDANGVPRVEIPNVSPVHLHQLMNFLVNSPPESVDPGLNAVVSPSSGGSRASEQDSNYSISPLPRVSPIHGDGTFLRYVGTPFRLQMGDI